MKTTSCPNCHGPARDAIVLGDADRDLEGLLECGCGATYTERGACGGNAAAYQHPRLRINLFWCQGAQAYMSVPGASLL
jgi:hypothetical protein